MKFEAIGPTYEPKLSDLPEFEGGVLPWLIPPFCDIYTESTIYIWARLVDGGNDLKLEAYSADFLGRPPEWTMYDELDIESITGVYRDVFDWGLQEGLAPGQPFVLEIEPTKYTAPSYEGEVDSWNDWAIVHRLPRRPEQAARAWIRAQKNIREFHVFQKESQEKLRRLQIEDTANLFLKTEEKRWISNGYQELSPPGVSVSLCSRHWRLPQPGDPVGSIGHGQAIAWGSNDAGSKELAFMDLLKNAQERCPGIDLQAIRQIKTAHHRF